MVIIASAKKDFRCCDYSDCAPGQTCENCPPRRSEQKTLSSVPTGASPSTPRRRLMFVDKVFDGKRFYLDPKGLAVSNVSILKLEADIATLGGTVEKFLSKEVTYVVTDKKEIQNAQSKTSTTKGAPIVAPFSRGQSLLAKSNANKIQYSNAILTAKQLGIRIIDIVSLNKIIREELNKCDPKAKWSQDQIDLASANSENTFKTKQLKGDIIKHEDESGLYRPVYSKLSKRPCLNFDAGFGGCPFEIHKTSRKPQSVSSDELEKSHSQNMSLPKEKDGISASQKSKHGSATKKAGKKKKDRCTKAGYCESCNLNYTDLKIHMMSRSHLDFIANIENFSVLDTCISSVPSLFDFENSTENWVQHSPKRDRKSVKNGQTNIAHYTTRDRTLGAEISHDENSACLASNSVTKTVSEKRDKTCANDESQTLDDTLVHEESMYPDQDGVCDVIAEEHNAKDIEEVNLEKSHTLRENLSPDETTAQANDNAILIQLEIKESFENTVQSGIVRRNSQAAEVKTSDAQISTRVEPSNSETNDRILKKNDPLVQVLPIKVPNALPHQAPGLPKIVRVLRVSQVPGQLPQASPVFRSVPSTLQPESPKFASKPHTISVDQTSTVSEKQANKHDMYSEISDHVAKYSDISSPDNSELNGNLINSAMMSLDCDIARQTDQQNVDPKIILNGHTSFSNLGANAAHSFQFDLSEKISQNVATSCAPDKVAENSPLSLEARSESPQENTVEPAKRAFVAGEGAIAPVQIASVTDAPVSIVSGSVNKHDGPETNDSVNFSRKLFAEATSIVPKPIESSEMLLAQQEPAIPLAMDFANSVSQNSCDINGDVFNVQQNPLDLLESLYKSAIQSKIPQSQTVPNATDLNICDDSQPCPNDNPVTNINKQTDGFCQPKPDALSKENSHSNHSTPFDIDTLLGIPVEATNSKSLASFDVANLHDFTARPSFADDLLEMRDNGKRDSSGPKPEIVEGQSDSSCDDVMAFNRQAVRQAGLNFAYNSENEDISPQQSVVSAVGFDDNSVAASLTNDESASQSTSSDSFGNSLKSEHERLASSSGKSMGFVRSSQHSRSLLLNACRQSHKRKRSEQVDGPDRSPSEISYCGESRPQAELCDVFNDNCVLAKPEVSGLTILQQMCEDISETSNHSMAVPNASEQSKERRLDFANVDFSAHEIQSSITSQCDEVESVIEHSDATPASNYGAAYSDISGESADPFLLRNELEEATSNSRLSFENILPFKNAKPANLDSGVSDTVAEGVSDVPTFTRGPYSDVSNDSVSSLDNTLVAYGSEISLSGSFHTANTSAQKVPKMCIAGDKISGNSGVLSYETSCSHKSLSSGYFSELQFSSVHSVADVNRNVSKIPSDCEFKKPQSRKPKQSRKKPKEARETVSGRPSKKRQRDVCDDVIEPVAKKRPVRNAAVVAMVALNEINDKDNDTFAKHSFDKNIADNSVQDIPTALHDSERQDDVFQTCLSTKQTDFTWKASVVSDLKLKVSKISTTPSSSRDSWSVEKSGDCKMTLSAKRSKKYRKRTEIGSGATPSRKRKLVYA